MDPILIRENKTDCRRGGLVFMIGLLVLVSFPWPLMVFGQDPGPALFEEAVKIIQAYSLRPVPPPPPPKDGRYRRAIKRYAKATGRYSDYLAPEEFRTFTAGFAPDYCGVGLKVDQTENGEFLCFPFPHGPAEKMGVKPMDRLVSVDGRPVRDRSMALISSMIRGQEGTQVILGIQSARDKKVRPFRLVRKKIDLKTVYLIQAPIPIIRITAFGEATPKELAQVLKALKPGQTKVIDLRSNNGGDLLASVEAASLFLPPRSRILEIKSRHDTELYRAETPPLDLESPLYLWQDSDTASAAEVFAAALVQNKRALSIGAVTYGKGVSQKPFPLSDGSALFLTFASLRGPNGRPYHNLGLAPDYLVPEASAKDNRAYMAILRKTLNQAPPKP